MNQPQTVNIELGDREWEGIYSNFVIITHSNAEFIIDFARMLPGAKRAKVFSRILMTPPSAKALMATLETNIKKFESEHGKIPLAPTDLNKANAASIGFQSATPPQEKTDGK